MQHWGTGDKVQADENLSWEGRNVVEGGTMCELRCQASSKWKPIGLHL